VYRINVHDQRAHYYRDMLLIAPRAKRSVHTTAECWASPHASVWFVGEKYCTKYRL